MDNNNIFNTTYSSSNPFSMRSNSGSSSALDSSLAQAYQRLEDIKKKQVQLDSLSGDPASSFQSNSRNVFSDIADELKEISQDELTFITSSPEYQKLNAQYQDDFSQFLISKFGNEFLQTGKQKTLEEILYTIKSKKDEYKKKFANEINEIRDQNKQLADRNNELAANNEKLQEQLKALQSQFIQ